MKSQQLERLCSNSTARFSAERLQRPSYSENVNSYFCIADPRYRRNCSSNHWQRLMRTPQNTVTRLPIKPNQVEPSLTRTNLTKQAEDSVPNRLRNRSRIQRLSTVNFESKIPPSQNPSQPSRPVLTKRTPGATYSALCLLRLLSTIARGLSDKACNARVSSKSNSKAKAA